MMCFNITNPIYAAENLITDAVADNMDDIEISNLLPCINAVASDYTCLDFEEEDFESLYVGMPIHTYEYLNTGSLRENDFIYYPIFSDEKLLFLILEKGDGTVQMTQGFTETLSKYIDKNVIIVYDLDEVYVLVDELNIMEVAYEYDNSSTERGDLTEISQLSHESIEWVELDRCVEVSSLENTVQPMADAVMPTVTLAVPKILQHPYGNICWAASTASIGNYLSGNNYSATYIAQSHYGADFNQRASLSVSLLMLISEYNVTYSYMSTNSVPTELKIYNNISAGYPMYGRWSVSSNSTHQTVIRGINHTLGYIYIMDPYQGYLTAQRTNNGGFTYVGESGYTFTLIGYASKL